MENQIILYQAEDETTSLEVRVEDETVWLSQAQMAELFQTSSQNITIHVKNVFKEKELYENRTCKDSLQVQKEGKRKVNRKIKLYNLDVIISVGYRVKSMRGTQFRIWANKVLKDYLLKGYAVNNRIDKLENDMHTVKNQLEKIDFQIHTSLPPNEGIFFNGQVFDAWVFATDLMKNAKESIILIDNYVDEQVLLLLSKRRKYVSAKIYTKNLSKQFQLDLKKHNSQYPEIQVRKFSDSHDRFLIIDEKEIYHIGASLKDLGKKWFAFSKISIPPDKILDNLPK
ncbi:MAG: virulence RhuM family protein [Bacteroidota bacterium]